MPDVILYKNRPLMVRSTALLLERNLSFGIAFYLTAHAAETFISKVKYLII